MHDPFAIIGGSVASLVAALTAARRGRDVALYMDPARPGGSFGGVRTPDGRRFDLGSRLFELDYEAVDPRPIDSFDPAIDTHRPFIRTIAAFIHELMGPTLRPARTPELWLHHRRIACPLMTADIATLPPILTATDRSTIRTEAQARLDPPRPQETPTLEQASLAQHGPRLHALLIEPLCAKQHPAWRDVLATERRKLWVALFHASTVHQAFSRIPPAFRPHRPFTTTTTNQLHPFVDRLFAAVKASRRITITEVGALTRLEPERAGTLSLRFACGTRLDTPPQLCAIGAPPAQVFPAAGLPWRPEIITASILWTEVPAAAIRSRPSTLLIPDPNTPILRISPACPGNVFAIEFGASKPDDATAERVLAETGIVRPGTRATPVHQLSGPARPTPTLANRLAFEAAAASLQAAGLNLLAGTRRFGFDGLNDQIADGLHFGATRC